MKPVTLTDADLIACRLIGNLRTLGWIAGKANYTPYNSQDVIGMNEDGFIGEYAFCKANNLFFDITSQPRRGGYDCLFHGQRIDVKTTLWETGKLMVKDIGNEDVDVYVLAIFNGQTVTFPGYCTAQRLRRDGKRYNNPDGTHGYEMLQSELTPWKNSQ